MVLVGLGSNRGDSLGIMREAMETLREFARPDSFRASSLWRTSPVDCPPGSGDFLNAVVGFDAREGLTPEALLAALKAIERAHGRPQVYERNAPRELDLDLLVYDDETRATEEFTLPHPRAADRLFVLAPAQEVAPRLVWPELGATVDVLLSRLTTDENVERLDG